MRSPALPHPKSIGLAVLLAIGAFAVPAGAGDNHAPAFSVKSVEGRAVRSSDYRNRPVIVDFWATWCAPCRASMPHLSSMQQRYAKRGLAVIGMSVDETGPAPVRRFARDLGVRFTIAMANDEVLDAYGPIRSIPTTFFINRKGEIVRRVVGYIDGETMEGYVQEILP
ncbi:MAG: TlpA family protein disulfide reductase [Candidatus Eisenbacteria bacterium]|nr:TlpA family protein disulfide reductase [Candidatus Eisenbacteria bacterium]